MTSLAQVAARLLVLGIISFTLSGFSEQLDSC